MRYIGNKENIVEKIATILQSNGVEGKSFFDFFAGTTNVGKYFKSKGLKVFSSDVMYLSFCLQKAYIENNDIPSFGNLLPHIEYKSSSLFGEDSALEIVLNHLSNIEPVKGFIFNNYTPEGTKSSETPRMYFSSENGAIIDAIRLKIEDWHNLGMISEHEYFILLACLIESVSFYANVAGVYAAFHKKWDPRAVKKLHLRPILLLDNGLQNEVFNQNSLNLLSTVQSDIFYLDPPYNGRQYLPNYHLIETIAKYDYPIIHGISGMREYEDKKSSFCNAKTALRDLDIIAEQGKFKYLVLSYNSEGIMPQEKIISTLARYGTVKLEQFEYARFKSNNNGLAKTKRKVLEQIYIMKK